MKKYQYLETFIYLAEEKSLTAAAKKLRLSKSVVSKRLAELEYELNSKLIWRDNRNFNLTPSGKEFLEHAIIAKNAVDKTFKLSQESSAEIAGEINLISPVTLGKGVILELIKAFQKEYPKVAFKITLQDHYTPLSQQNFDCAFRLIKEPDQNLRQLNLKKVQRLFCCSSTYSKVHGIPKRVEELKKHKIMAITSKQKGTNLEVSLKAKLSKVRLNQDIQVNNLEAIYKLVTEGYCIGVLPDYIAKEAIKSGRFLQILKNHKPITPFHDQISLVYRPGVYIPERLKAFRDFAVDYFNKI